MVPVPKQGGTSNPFNYRPITLANIPYKLLEHVIHSNLITFLEDKKFFDNRQHGFRKYFSGETQLLVFTKDLFSITYRGAIVDCIFLDFQKAFDPVSHQRLLLKLSVLNIDTSLVKWIECFLSKGTQCVSANNCSSPLQHVTSGVPQGSVLGPLLFLININDFPNNISSTIGLHADDCVIYREVTNPEYSVSL